MKILGIDFGTKRIGIATSDEAGEFAFPKAILSNDTDAIEKIVALIKDEGVDTVVIGESIASNEAANSIEGKVKKFADVIGEKTRVSVVFEREDFSSVEAHRYQTGAGNRDDSAAAIILQRYLDKRKK